MNSRHLPDGPEMADADIEENLRRCAPALRPELRERVLLRGQPRDRLDLRPRRLLSPARWAVAAGVLCVLQWLAVSHLDARGAAAIHGPNGQNGRASAPLWARSAKSSGATARRAEPGWPQALQRRALLLGALMDDTDTPLNPAPPAQAS